MFTSILKYDIYNLLLHSAFISGSTYLCFNSVLKKMTGIKYSEFLVPHNKLTTYGLLEHLLQF